MNRIIRSGIVATVATVAVAVGVSGCKSSGSSASATAAATASSATTPPPVAAVSSGGSAVVAGASASAAPVAASSGAVADPCALATAADVSAALGATVPPSTSEFTGTYQICNYATAEDSTGDATIVIVLSRLIDKAGFDANAKQSAGLLAPLPSVCQDAYVAGSKVYGWKNGTEVDASVDGMPAGGDPVAAVTKLVTGACARV
jgi:hypothetical protein